MDSVTSTSSTRSTASAAASRPAFSAAKAGLPRFGAAAPVTPPVPPGGSGEAVKLGFVKTLRALHQYFKVGENRMIVKGLAYQYGVPAAVGAAFLFPPVGWVIGGLGLIPSIIVSKRGEKIIDKLENAGALHKTSGPLARVTAIKQQYQNAKIGDGNKIIGEYNRLLDELLIDNESVKNLGAIRERLKLVEGGRATRALDHVFNVKLHYADRWQGKLLKYVNKSTTHIPIKIIRMPIVAASMVFQGLLVLLSHRSMKGVAGAALRKLA